MKKYNRGIIGLSVVLAAGILVVIFALPHVAPEETSLEIITPVATPSQRYSNAHKSSIRIRTTDRDTREIRGRYQGDTPDLSVAEPHFLKVEINSADTSTFKRLRGIGSTYARRIVKYRNLLGGFISIEQLKEVYGLSDSLYQMIKPHLEIETGNIQRIDLHHVTLQDLAKHPYLDTPQAKAVIRYRDHIHNISNPEDLYNIPLLDSTTIKRITPYLDFDTNHETI